MKYSVFITIAAATLLAACSSTNKPVDTTNTPAQKQKTGQYTIGQIAVRPLSGFVKLPGQLKPYEEVNIYAKVNGFVKQLYVDRGSMVHKGQVLARLEAPEMGSQVEAANSKYIEAQEAAAASAEKYRRLKEASAEPGAVAPLELDNAIARMRADQAAVQSEKAAMSAVSSVSNYLVITAPFDGVITQRNVSVGALVGSGKGSDQPMLVLQQAGKLRLEVAIPEDYTDKIDAQRPASFTLTASPGQEYSATISRSANALGSMRTEAIEIDVPNSGGQLKPGMYAEVKIPLLSDATSLLVPSAAIVRSTERMYVVLVQQGKAHLDDVKEGLKTNDSTQVFGNLKGNEDIVLNATDDIKEGDSIK